jgi:hypothetical protein
MVNNSNRVNAVYDYNRISDLTSKYPRQIVPENQDQNMELGGVYQSFVYKLGQCMGCCRTYIPCCCCATYPYQQIDQSFVGEAHLIQVYTKDSANIVKQLDQVCSISTPSPIK